MNPHLTATSTWRDHDGTAVTTAAAGVATVSMTTTGHIIDVHIADTADATADQLRESLLTAANAAFDHRYDSPQPATTQQ
jgi:DNA-binding protein YbaB